MLDNERYESRAVNDRLNRCEGSSEVRETMQKVPPEVFGVKLDGVFVARMSNTEIRGGAAERLESEGTTNNNDGPMSTRDRTAGRRQRAEAMPPGDQANKARSQNSEGREDLRSGEG